MVRSFVYRYIRKLLKHNYSYFVNLPKYALELLGWKEQDRLYVRVDLRSREIIIRKIRKTKLKGGHKNAL